MTAVRDVTGRLATWLRRLMPDGDRQAALMTELAAFRDDDRPVTAELCARVEAAAWRVSRHVALIFEPDGTGAPDTEARQWPRQDPAAVRARAGSVSQARRLPDGTALIRVDGLDEAGLAAPYVDAAFTLARGARRLVLDLRANGGGDPATVALIAGWLLGDEAVRLSEVVDRDGRRQWWTADRPPGSALTLDTTVLVGPGTFSSGEALAYHLRARDRVLVVGEATPGAADHVLPVRLAPTVLAHVPRAYVVDAVTGTNWEGTGVVPHRVVPVDQALDAALSGSFPG
ncbi:S41 family peptidase [Dactylosporangium aurantiacum]|uniref:S41 family peptidase n=1 Tax=Dactylosporangium aurantiacum TaxID=35754 RepID=A0A9Q9IGC9_9ACTN|nr:S41 family peptidase [Dactylosporangium aurantiacum]MDG6101472.1 S41 family peptidase [Dactylosporangium aurantiacum]UWZ52678.1 S41 family peptidase [Dactylosporangium aurantiacum]